MVDIITDSDRELKDIRQIGTPSEIDKIYIEHLAYERLHQEDVAEKRVFVFMGHTQRKERGYLTFVKAVIPVYDMEFEQNVPVWNNRIWSGIFREIKNFYENEVIVGWAIDLKGIEPKISPQIEAVHREQFGGAHQILLLMDSLEQEEYFYQNRNNRLHKKDGFYIYYDAAARIEGQNVDLQLELPMDRVVFRRKGALAQTMDNWQEPQAVREDKERAKPKGQYRAMLEGKAVRESPGSGKKLGAFGVVAVLALLLGIAGTGIYQNRSHIGGLQKMLETFGSDAVVEEDSQKESEADTEKWEELSTESGENAQSEAIETLTNMQNTDAGEPATDVGTEEDYVQVEQTPGGTIMDSPPAAPVQDSSNLEEIPDVAVTETMEAMAEQNQPVQPETPEYYTVKRGDTLTSICYTRYGDVARLTELENVNALTNPDDIREGQQLVLPQ